MDSREKLIRLALFGSPIKSSLSPAIHGMFADQFGLNIQYDLHETGVAGFSEALDDFQSRGGVGCNVTLPLKEEAWRLAANASKEVRRARAANTLVYEHGIGWMAYTTDGPGLVRDLTVNHGVKLKDKRVLILGAGGATASVLESLAAGSPDSLTLVNRDLARACALAERFAPMARISVINWQALREESGFDLVINATSLGHQGLAPELERHQFAKEAICYDLNYYKASEPLRRLCGEFNLPYIDGLGMLVEQAAASFQIWTGQQPDSRTVIDALAKRHG